jgi:Domain of unknown function (DUF4118)
VTKGILPKMAFVMSLSALILATPKPAHAYVDPGSGAMLWQVAAAAVIGSLFYVRRVLTWVRDHLGFRSTRITGYLFATLFALIASPLTVVFFDGHPLPRFNDLFLIGIVLTAYLFTWDSAAYLFVVSLAVSAWVLPPYGSFAVSGFNEWYRMVSFAVVSVLLIFLITRLKTRGAASAEREEERPLRMHGAAAGAD